MDRPDADDDADVRLGDLREFGDLAASAHRHLQDEHLGAARGAEDLQREADLGVEVRAARDGAPVWRQDRLEEVLGRRLAGGAGDADDVGVDVPAPSGGELLEGLQGVRRCEDRFRWVLGVCRCLRIARS